MTWNSRAGPLSLSFGLSVPIFVSFRVTVVDGEGVEHLGVAMPQLGFHNGVRSHLPEVNVASCAPQRSCGELRHDVASLNIVERKQVFVQDIVFLLGDTHCEAHCRDG